MFILKMNFKQSCILYQQVFAANRRGQRTRREQEAHLTQRLC